MAMNEPVAVAILAKAPIAGFAKTRLIPVLGARGAAVLQERLVGRAVETACAAAIGPVTLWATPDESHPVFQSIAARLGITLARQADGDLGERMLAAITAANRCVLLIGSDCPALTLEHLRTAADVLRDRAPAVVIPAEDGGYVLIALNRDVPRLFEGVEWGTGAVLRQTRARFAEAGVRCVELAERWDVDRPDDYARLQAEGLLQEVLS